MFFRLSGSAMDPPVHEIIASLFSSDGLLVRSSHALYEAQGRVGANRVVLLVTWERTGGETKRRS